ncbi:helix-turn-helix transcriptional regulator [Neobacillus drentensis]|uniref:helix-turn-helix transcriptional regulator n=1 Tax=Neobacillus drentensis TaxID=220684 RepID=UPI00286052EB|nr:helix-turn-helix transcriptional regulator [Neobacillus drentensis]MDR7237098.1 DNA-binding XRE family transcriptional regulator [Neobacillus drentensis]
MKFNCRLKVIFAEEKLKDRNFTQKKFAERIGVTDTTLSQIANGRSLPSFEVAYKIVKALERPLEEIWIENEQ